MNSKRSFKEPISLIVVSLALFFMPEVAPREFWYSAFLVLFIPLIIIIQFLLLLFWAFKKNIFFLLPLFLLVLNWKYIKRTITFSSPDDNKTELSILSYNVRVFNVYAQFADPDFKSSRNIMDFLIKSNADVLCLQEFYNDPKDSIFNTIKKIKIKYKYCYYNVTYTNSVGATFGMAIFSKYPIIFKDKVLFNQNSNNQILYADIACPQAVIRVYNMHLQSMNINDQEISGSHFDKE